MIRTLQRVFKLNSQMVVTSRFISYTQGQSPEPKVREYFYFVNHEGMLFLDDARMKNFTSCFKDKKFLEFFFKRLKINDTQRYRDDFPYISPCGRERNFIRCDDVPIVFTHILPSPTTESNGQELLTYCYAGDLLTVKFEPNKIFMSNTGKVYHPAPERYGSIGLIRSKLAIELSKLFEFRDGEEAGPTGIKWKERDYTIDTSWVDKTVTFKPL